MTTPSIGSPVPDFEAQSTGEKIFQLSDYRGKYAVLYFYPKDNTPGCTQEGQHFRDNIEKFTAFECGRIRHISRYRPRSRRF